MVAVVAAYDPRYLCPTCGRAPNADLWAVSSTDGTLHSGRKTCINGHDWYPPAPTRKAPSPEAEFNYHAGISPSQAYRLDPLDDAIVHKPFSHTTYHAEMFYWTQVVGEGVADEPWVGERLRTGMRLELIAKGHIPTGEITITRRPSSAGDVEFLLTGNAFRNVAPEHRESVESLVKNSKPGLLTVHIANL